MISFSQFCESQVVGGFNISRDQMPQIKDQDKFIAYLKAVGIECELIDVEFSNVKPTQTNIDQNKVDVIIPSSSKPVIISSDYYILDGHHRFYAAMLVTQDNILSVCQANTSINKLLYYAKEFLEHE